LVLREIFLILFWSFVAKKVSIMLKQFETIAFLKLIRFSEILEHVTLAPTRFVLQ